MNTDESGTRLRGVLVAGAPSPACAYAQGSVWIGRAAQRLLRGEGDRETFERRQTLPLSTLTPTISHKKAVNPLLPGQARGKVTAERQLPSLPRLVPFGQVNNFIATTAEPPALAGSFPKPPGCPSSARSCGALLGFGSSMLAERGRDTVGITRGRTVATVKGRRAAHSWSVGKEASGCP